MDLAQSSASPGGQWIILCLLGLLALGTFVVAWKRDDAWDSVKCFWVGLMLCVLLDHLVRRITGTYVPSSHESALQLAIIGWLPGLAIHGVVVFIKHFFFWNGK